MYVCVLNQDGEVLLHREMQAAPGPFLKAIASYREDLVVCVACLFTWDWLADLCTQEGMPVVLGHALDMKAIHGGKANNDRVDAHNIAVLWRGGMRPPASVYPAGMRATRDLRRRRRHLTRQRAEWLAHIPHTHSQYHLPEIGQQLASKANRDGVAERCPASAVQQSIEVDLTLIDASDRWLTDLELDRVRTATAHEAQTFDRLRSIPGVGTILALVLRYEIHAMQRFPRVQAFVSDGRLVTCATEAAGTRSGTSGKKLGHADLTWAFSEAAVLCLRNHPAGQQYRARLVNTPGTGQAFTVLAHQLARAVYDLLNRDTAFAMDKFFNESRRGARAPAASLAAAGISLASECWCR
jgi:transposase